MKIVHDNTDFSKEFNSKMIKHIKYLCDKYPIIKEKILWTGTIQKRNELYASQMIDLAMKELIQIMEKNKIKATAEQVRDKKQEIANHFKEESKYCGGFYGTEFINTPIEKVMAVFSDDVRLGNLQGIAINKKWAGNYQALTKEMTCQSITGAHPEGTGEGVSLITHEFGHVLYRLMKKKEIVFKELTDHWELMNRTTDFWGKDSIRSERFWANTISVQAALSMDEFFAECFSEYIHNPNCRHTAKMVGQEIDKLINLFGEIKGIT